MAFRNLSSVIAESGIRWELGEELGGVGRVFAATGPDGTVAAIKFVPKEPGADRELLFVAVGDVPNVVPVIDHGEVDNFWFLIMPRAVRSLADRMASPPTVTSEESLSILLDLATALAGLSELSSPIVHRDIKPQNVLELAGRWKLADFGISRYAEASTAADTHKYAMSPFYAAPERWRSERASAATDIYAVGVLAHELLNGKRRFLGPGLSDLRAQHLHENPPELAGLPRLTSLISECLYKAPEARPTPANFLARLRKVDAAATRGSAALADAYRKETSRLAAHETERSREISERERRQSLFVAASKSLEIIFSEIGTPSVTQPRRQS